MKFSNLVVLIVAVLVIVSCGKDPVDVCTTTRYTENIFTETKQTKIEYTKSLGVSGGEETFFMDVFEPVGDELDKRPVIVWAHGGSFISGSRLDMAEICKSSALKGFVAVSIDYRLLSLANGIPDSVAMTDIAIKSMQDFKSAVRFLRKDAQTTNRFKIDPDNVYAGGVSAGAIIALNAGCLDDTDAIPQFVKALITKNGGLNGGSGTVADRSISSDVKAVISLSGAVIDPVMIDNGDPQLFLMHGDADDVVPYDLGFARVGPIQILRLYGSKRIHEQAGRVGVGSLLATVPGGGHVDIYTEAKFAAAFAEFNTKVYSSMKDIICN